MPQQSNPPILIRRARPDDLVALLELEDSSFTGDRLNRRRMRHWVAADNGALLVAEVAGEVLAYALLIYRRGSRIARVYSLAVATRARGRGLAGQLMTALEADARSRRCTHIRLEVAAGNTAARQLYEKLGYRSFATYPAYYEDGGDALRMEKLVSSPAR